MVVNKLNYSNAGGFGFKINIPNPPNIPQQEVNDVSTPERPLRGLNVVKEERLNKLLNKLKEEEAILPYFNERLLSELSQKTNDVSLEKDNSIPVIFLAAGGILISGIVYLLIKK